MMLQCAGLKYMSMTAEYKFLRCSVDRLPHPFQQFHQSSCQWYPADCALRLWFRILQACFGISAVCADTLKRMRDQQLRILKMNVFPFDGTALPNSHSCIKAKQHSKIFYVMSGIQLAFKLLLRRNT